MKYWRWASLCCSQGGFLLPQPQLLTFCIDREPLLVLSRAVIDPLHLHTDSYYSGPPVGLLPPSLTPLPPPCFRESLPSAATQDNVSEPPKHLCPRSTYLHSSSLRSSPSACSFNSNQGASRSLAIRSDKHLYRFMFKTGEPLSKGERRKKTISSS